MEFVGEDGQPQGADIDLAKAISGTLDLRLELVNERFSTIIPSIAISRYDLGIASLWADKPAASLADMVTYLRSGIRFVGRTGANAPTDGIHGLCGYSVAVEEGTEFIDDLVALSTQCTGADQQPIKIISTLTLVQTMAALNSGRADSALADETAAKWAVSRSGGKLTLIGKPVEIRPYGIAVDPKQDDFAELIQATVQHLIANGVYDRITKDWGLIPNRIETPRLLQGTQTDLLKTATPAADR